MRILIMDFQRNFIVFACLIVAIFFWYLWKKDTFHNLKENNKINFRNDDLKHNTQYLLKNKVIIKTDVLKLVVNKYGGNIDQADLLQYNDTLESLKHYRLLNTSKDFVYQAQSGLTGINGPDNPVYNTIPNYVTSKKLFQLRDYHKELRVPMRWVSKEGIIYIKTFILKPKQYVIKVKFDIFNNTQKVLKVSMFGQLKQTANLIDKTRVEKPHTTFQTFRGSAFSTAKNKFCKHEFNKIQNNENILITTKAGWVSMIEQYFATAWIPNNQFKNTIYTKKLEDNIVAIGYKSDTINIQPNVKYTITSKLWVGPKIQKEMALVAKNLDMTVDYGWLWFISQPLFKLLNVIFKLVNNWGVAIIIITCIMKIITFPLSRMQYVSMAKIRKLQPKINEIKKKYKNNKQQLSQSIIDLYKKNRINPLGGCLPVLVQMPIFLALYYMLMNSVELRHAPFILWIRDLSSKDPYYILPIVMGFSMLLIQKTSPNNSLDDKQQKILSFMPVILTTFFLWFPSGLVLYYIISNILTVIQQQLLSYSMLKNKKKF